MSIKYLYILILSLCLYTSVSFAQNQKAARIELIQANSFEFNKKLGEDVRRLIGSVIFRHENYYLYCDSAYLYSSLNSLDAFGKVRISSGDTLNIYGDILKYDGNNRIANLNKNVRMVDKQMTLTTNSLTYSLKTDIGSYTTGGTLVDPENTLKSKIGYYYADKKKFFFKDNVVLTNPKYTMSSDTLMYNTISETAYFFGPTYIVSKNNTIFCEYGNYNTRTDISQFSKKVYVMDSTQRIQADSIYYSRKEGISKAYDNILITDSKGSTLITGNRGVYNEISGLLFITSKAQLIMIEKEDSLFLHSDTLKALPADTSKKNRILFAFHNVRFFRHDLQGSCDSLIYNTKDSIIQMKLKPVLWTENNQMTADMVKISIGNKKIKNINFVNSALIVSKFDSVHFDQIKGKDMIAWFKDNKLNRLDVKSNAQTIYHIKNDKGKLIGINKSTSPDMRIYSSDNKVNRVVHIDQTEGTFFPLKDFPKDEAFFKDFHWYQDIRPKTKADIFK